MVHAPWKGYFTHGRARSARRELLEEREQGDTQCCEISHFMDCGERCGERTWAAIDSTASLCSLMNYHSHATVTALQAPE